MAKRRDAAGSGLGLLVFFGGVGLLGLTFKLAYDLFEVPHARALGLVKGQAIDARVTGGAAADLVIRLAVLVVMAVVGSMIANRGIGLYGGSLHPVERPAREAGSREAAESL